MLSSCEPDWAGYWLEQDILVAPLLLGLVSASGTEVDDSRGSNGAAAARGGVGLGSVRLPTTAASASASCTHCCTVEMWSADTTHTLACSFGGKPHGRKSLRCVPEPAQMTPLTCLTAQDAHDSITESHHSQGRTIYMSSEAAALWVAGSCKQLHLAQRPGSIVLASCLWTLTLR